MLRGRFFECDLPSPLLCPQAYLGCRPSSRDIFWKNRFYVAHSAHEQWLWTDDFHDHMIMNRAFPMNPWLWTEHLPWTHDHEQSIWSWTRDYEQRIPMNPWLWTERSPWTHDYEQGTPWIVNCGFFHILDPKITYFQYFFLTFLNLHLEERSFVTIIIFSCFLPPKSVFKFNLLITFDLSAVDNFWGHIWNQHILLGTILEFKKNRSTLLIIIHPSTRTTNLFVLRNILKAFKTVDLVLETSFEFIFWNYIF